MKPLTRFLGAVQGEAIDHPACVPLIFGYSASISGVKLRDYLQKGEIMAQCQLQAQKRFGHDALFVNAGNSVEAEALGCVLHYPERDYPYITKGVWEELNCISALTLPDPWTTGRMPELLRACNILHRKAGNELPVVGCVLGPVSIAGQLAGLDKLLYLLVDAPEQFQHLLEQVAKLSRDFGRALLKAGAQVIMLLEPSASQNIFPASIFSQFVEPLLTELFTDYKKSGALATWLMVTGRTKEILPYYKNCGADLATIDYEVSLKEGIEVAPGLPLAGNIRPYDLAQREPEEIKRQCLELLETGREAQGFILSTGCEVPLNSKPENIQIMVATARGELGIG